MSLIEFFRQIDDEIKTINSSDFDIEVIETTTVPNFSDPDITHDNFDAKRKKCKRLESCVLYVDIRDSSKISSERRPQTLSKMYSCFVRSMILCARYYGGHVRNIIGDRVMVVFDQDNCFINAVHTAYLMNTVCHFILNKRISGFEFRAGIGIDFGKMLITKTGTIRKGEENEFYRSLVWLGKPANVASRLTDLANKIEIKDEIGIAQGFHYPHIGEWHWDEVTFEEFIDQLEDTSSRDVRHKDSFFKAFFKTEIDISVSLHPPILISQSVFEGYARDFPSSKSITEGWWSKQSIQVRDYDGIVYGGNIYYSAIESV